VIGAAASILFDGMASEDWTGTLRLLAAELSEDGPAIVVLWCSMTRTLAAPVPATAATG